MNLQELKIKIKNEFKNTLIELGYFSEELQIELETPKDKSNGDFSSNIAMKLARIARKAPIKIAEEIVQKFNKEDVFVSKVEAANPGFINLFLDESFLTSIITEINDLGFEYGQLDIGKGERVNIEYVSGSTYLFENFINFSSAVERLDNFFYKVQLIEYYKNKYYDLYDDIFFVDKKSRVFNYEHLIIDKLLLNNKNNIPFAHSTKLSVSKLIFNNQLSNIEQNSSWLNDCKSFS